MQIPNAVGTLANSVLPATPTQGALPSQVGENADSVSFAPIEEVSAAPASNPSPEERPNQQAEQAVTENASRSSGDAEAEQGDAAQADRAEGPTADREARERQAEERAVAQQRQDQQIIRQLSSRDQEVRAHEQAHAAVGGQYAGAANFTYERGPDGVNYAVGGEVPIDVGAIQGNPQATLEKMLVVQRAALAPAEPSAQDRRVAALAANQANQARAEILADSRSGASESSGDSDEPSNVNAEVQQNREAERLEKEEREAERAKSNEKSQANLSEQFQGFNARITRINNLLQEINQTSPASEAGALLDAVV